MDKKQKKKKKNENFGRLLGGIIGVLIGIFISIFWKNPVSDLFFIVSLLLSLPVALILGVPIHEAGHLCMGLLTGYKFVSFRVGKLVFVKKNEKLSITRSRMPGVAGQCVLEYGKEVEDPSDIPYFWCNFGGSLFNFITALLCLIPIFVTENGYITVFFLSFCFYFFLFGFLNLLPGNSQGIGTDGFNIRAMKRDPVCRCVAYKNLAINAELYRGKMPEEISERLMNFPEEEKNCELGEVMKMTEADLIMRKRDFVTAEEKFRSAVYAENSSQFFGTMCKCEMIFCMMMNGADKQQVDELIDKALKKHIDKESKTSVSIKRFLYTYALLIEKDTVKAERIYAEALKIEKTYPVRGEYLSDMKLIEYVKTVGTGK